LCGGWCFSHFTVGTLSKNKWIGFLQRLLEAISQSVNDFIEVCQKKLYLLWIFFTKRQPNNLEAIRAHSKNTALIFRYL
jgi:hypothetical protein